MSVPLCQVCWNPKRKPRFQTRSIFICQWCITELTNSLESPNQIIESAKEKFREKRMSPLVSKLNSLLSNDTQKPQFPTADLMRAAVRAKQQILEGEGIGQFVYRQFLDSSGREREVVDLTKQFQGAITTKHDTKLKSHELVLRKLEDEIAAVKIEIANVEALVEMDFNKYIDIRLSPRPTKFSATRMLRAHNLELIQGERIYARRPEGAEAAVLGRYVRKRDNNVCVICNCLPNGSELHVHHIIPLTYFGTNHERNLATLCYSCHSRQHPEFEVQRVKTRTGSRRSEV